jgi:hypothetical protein
MQYGTICKKLGNMRNSPHICIYLQTIVTESTNISMGKINTKTDRWRPLQGGEKGDREREVVFPAHHKEYTEPLCLCLPSFSLASLLSSTPHCNSQTPGLFSHL